MTQSQAYHYHVLLICEFLLEIIVLAFHTVISYLTCIAKFLLPKVPKSLKNEIILVTGGANGIGREICLQLAEIEKCITIISWDVDDVSNAILIEDLKALGVQNSYGFSVDVSDRIQVDKMAKKIQQEIGDVTILFNNAGIIGDVGSSWEISPDSLERVFKINVMAHCWTHRAFLPIMIKKGHGHIIEICSVLSFSWGKYNSPYIASKFALKGYIESVKEDLRQLSSDSNILVSLVHPHNTMTALTAPLNFKSRKYSFLLPQMTPDFVASKIIDGMRRNEEHIYIPGYLRFISMILPLLPSDIIRRIIDICDLDCTPSAHHRTK